MDLDAFAAVREPSWSRLDTLSRRARLSGSEADEIVRLYQEVATDLSAVRAAAPDPAVISRLSDVLGRARTVIAGAPEAAWRDLARFLGAAVPAAMYRIRWWTVAVMVAFVAVAVVAALNVVADPAVQAGLGTPAELAAYAESEFAAYYSNFPGSSFAAQVWTNNAWIAAQCVAFGITGIWPVLVIVQNAVGVGTAAALMALHDGLDVFFALILPHGLLELTAIFVAAGAGLRLFWTMVDPGGRPRPRALAEEGRSLMAVALGLVLVLGVSGLVEGFVTPSDLPWWLKIVIGVLVLAGYWLWVLVPGRRAAAAGETGDVRAEHREDVLPVAS